MELSERKKRILKSIVDSYIESGEPVGSKYLTTSYDFSVSPATIRNEMSELEDMGYLAQPHTSAGRVPTTLGFQTYISSLMEKYRLTMEEIQLLNELTAFKAEELSHTIELAGKLISKMTNCASFTVFSKPEDTAERFEVVMIDSSSFLIVMICGNDEVKSSRVKSHFPVTKEDLCVIQDALNKSIVGLKANEISMQVFMEFEKSLGTSAHFATECIKAIYCMLNNETKEEVHFDGITKLLSYPEFSSVSGARDVLSIVEERTKLLDILSESDNNDLNVFIGDGDNDSSKLPSKDACVVFHPIKINGQTVGAIGIIGPKRLDYKKVIASLDYLASNINLDADENKTLNNNPTERQT